MGGEGLIYREEGQIYGPQSSASKWAKPESPQRAGQKSSDVEFLFLPALTTVQASWFVFEFLSLLSSLNTQPCLGCVYGSCRLECHRVVKGDPSALAKLLEEAALLWDVQMLSSECVLGGPFATILKYNC